MNLTQPPIQLVEYPALASEHKLIKLRGWTQVLVRRHLGPPDAMAINPSRREKPVGVYWMERVEAAERRPEVIRDLQRIADGRKLKEMIDDGSMEALRQQLATDLETVPIEVVTIPLDDLRSRAYAARNQDPAHPPLAYPESELPRVSMVYYAKQHLVDRASLAAFFEPRAEPWQVEYLLRNRITAAVLAVFPNLAPPEDGKDASQ